MGVAVVVNWNWDVVATVNLWENKLAVLVSVID